MENEHIEHEEHGSEHNKTCRCMHHKAVPILAIVFGAVFLLAEVNVLTWGFVNVTWPVLLIVFGIWKLTSDKCTCCANAK